MQEPGSISLRLNPRPALDAVGRLEREMTRLLGRSANKKIKVELQKVRNVIDKSVGITIDTTYVALLLNTPKQTKFLVSNWKVAQGRTPALGRLLIRPPGRAEYSLPSNLVSPNAIDGTRVQWIYNQTSYAKPVAAGVNASGGPIRSGGGPMWFIEIGQNFSSGLYYKEALSVAIAREGR